MSDLTEWRPGETTAQWVERVTGEILTANQTAAVDTLLHRSALAGETDAYAKLREIEVEMDRTRDIEAAGNYSWLDYRKHCVTGYTVGYALLVQLQDKNERIKAYREAATWVLHVVSGVGKDGNPPSVAEETAAFDALKQCVEAP